MILICGVDPGVNTGVAVGLFDGVSMGEIETMTLGPARTIFEEIQVGEFIRDTCLKLARDLDVLILLAIEDFILIRFGSSDRDGLAPVRVTAQLEAAVYCSRDALKFEVTKFAPSAAKSIVTDSRLKNWGGWIKGKPHERDACRQLFMAVRQKRTQSRST